MTTWIESIVDALATARGGVIVRVADGRVHALGALARALATTDPDLVVTASAERLLALPDGALAIYLAAPADAALLNMSRPLFADRKLRVVVWTDREAGAALRRGAPDFVDWVTLTVQCPATVVPQFWTNNLRVAISSRARGAAWLARDSVRPALAALGRGGVLTLFPPALDDDGAFEYVGAADLPRTLIVDGVGWADDPATRRARWLLASSSDRVFAVFVPHRHGGAAPATAPGFWPIDTRLAPLRRFTRQGSAAGLLLAALVDFEAAVLDELEDPVALSRDEVTLLATSEDPGRVLRRRRRRDRASAASVWAAVPERGWDVAARCGARARGWGAARREWAGQVRRAIEFLRTRFDRDPYLRLSSDAEAAIRENTGFDALALLDAIEWCLALDVDDQDAAPCLDLGAIAWKRWSPRLAALALEARLRTRPLTNPEYRELAILARRAGDPRAAARFDRTGAMERWAASTADVGEVGWFEEVVARSRAVAESGDLPHALEIVEFGLRRPGSNLSAVQRLELRVRQAVIGLELGYVHVVDAVARELKAGDPRSRRVALHLEAFELCRRGADATSYDLDALSVVGPRERADGETFWELHVAACVAALEALPPARSREAIARLDRLASEFERYGQGSVELLAGVALARARIYERSGDSGRARTALAPLRELDAIRRNARHYLGLRADLLRVRLHRREGDYRAARRLLEATLRRYAAWAPDTTADYLLARCESTTLALLERPANAALVDAAERAVADALAVFLPTHPEIQRHRGVIELKRASATARATG